MRGPWVGELRERDGVDLWGTATVDTDLETKRRLWTGVFTYNLDDFGPEGLETPDNCFIAVWPERVLALKQYGMASREHGAAPDQQPRGSFLVRVGWLPLAGSPRHVAYVP